MLTQPQAACQVGPVTALKQNGSVQHVIQNPVDDAAGGGYQDQIPASTVPFITSVMRQVPGMAGRHPVAPAVR